MKFSCFELNSKHQRVIIQKHNKSRQSNSSSVLSSSTQNEESFSATSDTTSEQSSQRSIKCKESFYKVSFFKN